ncbi:MAG: GH3 auxin-responsive promoter family protein [Chitinophagaceae bacterium]|nr:GH3 auxin-responsive promoter family protein [Chitinophagaceae bacterium]
MANIIDFKLPHAISNALRLPENDSRRQQLRVLKKLLQKSKFTSFGQHYRFDEILLSRHAGKKFQDIVPVHDYSKIYEEWWKKTLDGVPDVTWPGKIKYYALSSGTSEAASKYIPVTKDMLRSNRVNYIRQLLSLINYENFSRNVVTKGFLMLGGATDLQKGKAGWYAGDLSGILMKNRPFWFQTFYKPGGRIAAIKDWNHKLHEIVEKAKDWDIGFIVGVPAWCQMCMEMVIEHYKVKTIHDIWPNLGCFVHGGVAFEPYKKGFEKLLAKPIIYIENYLASEGFIGYKDREDAKGIKLILNNNIFMEFVPFDDKNFDSDGKMIERPHALMIHEVEEGKEYALLISTNSGAWRYLIGDTIRFVDVERSEIVITGRTKHFLSLVGEHLSVENMNKAVQLVSDELNISIPEFTVVGIPWQNFFAHQWYVACDHNVGEDLLCEKIDKYLGELNDDYAVERTSALKKVFLKKLPEKVFMKFMEKKGKLGSQHKFPRVLKGKMLQEWNEFLNSYAVPVT